MQNSSPYTLSVEPENGPTFQMGFHVGTREVIARREAELVYRRRILTHLGHVSPGQIRTVALMLDGRVVDVYDEDGWLSEASERFLSADD